jgi:hypothetical protein
MAAPGRDWEKLTPWIVAGLLTLLAVIHAGRHGGDFLTYWRAAGRFLHGAPLYPSADGLNTYRYSPGVLLFLAPLGALPFPVAKALWFAALVATGWWVARQLVRLTPGPGAGRAVLIGFIGVSRPFLDEFFYAQVDVLVLGLVVLAFVAEDRGRDGLAGAMIAVAGGLKLAPFLFALDFALRRRWRALAGVAAGVASLAAFPVATYGFAGTVDVHMEWFHSLRTSAAGLVGSQDNQGIFGIIAHLAPATPDGRLPPGTATWLALAGAVGVVAWALRSPFPSPRRALLLFALALAAPLGWMWNFVTAWPALSLLARSGTRIAWAIGIYGILTLLSIYDIVGPRIETWIFIRSLPGFPLLVFFVLTGLIRTPEPD